MASITSNTTLVIKRAFAPIKNKKTGKTLQGTSVKKVEQVMGQFGNIVNTQFITQKDYKNGENFRVFFIHYNTLHLMSDELKTTLEQGGTIEVGNDDKGHYWLVTKYTPKESSEKKTSQPISHGVRIHKPQSDRQLTPADFTVVLPLPPLDIDLESQYSDEEAQIPPAPTEDKVISLEE